MKEDYSTIEHDYLHVKDYFGNYKFTYKERKSKLDFLLSINHNAIQDTSSLINSTKCQLKEVKKVYKELDEEIRSFSKCIYDESECLDSNKAKYENLMKEESKLLKELENIKDFNEKLEANHKLNSKLDAVEVEINNTFLEIEELKMHFSNDNIELRKQELASLKETKNDLAQKQKRLTIVNIHNYVEDIYCWYELLKDILEKILGKIIVSSSETFNIRFQKSEGNFLEIELQGNKLKDVLTSQNLMNDEFTFLKQYSMMINDASFLILTYLSHE